MKCANCDNDAMYIYDLTTKTSIPYCGKHLPLFLEQRKKAGLLRTTDQHDTSLDEASAVLSSASASETTITTLDDSTIKPAPVKKAAKKKAE